MSSVRCDKCKRDIFDKKLIMIAIVNFTTAKCKDCGELLNISVSSDQVDLLPEPHRSQAMAMFSGCD